MAGRCAHVQPSAAICKFSIASRVRIASWPGRVHTHSKSRLTPAHTRGAMSGRAMPTRTRKNVLTRSHRRKKKKKKNLPTYSHYTCKHILTEASLKSCTYILTETRTHAHTETCTHILTETCTQKHTHKNMRAHISTETCTHTHSNRNMLCAHNMHTFTHRDIHTQTKKKLETCSQIYNKTCTHIYTKHAHTYSQIHERTTRPSVSRRTMKRLQVFNCFSCLFMVLRTTRPSVSRRANPSAFPTRSL